MKNFRLIRLIENFQSIDPQQQQAEIYCPGQNLEVRNLPRELSQDLRTDSIRNLFDVIYCSIAPALIHRFCKEYGKNKNVKQAVRDW